MSLVLRKGMLSIISAMYAVVSYHSHLYVDVALILCQGQDDVHDTINLPTPWGVYILFLLIAKNRFFIQNELVI
jgi:hypothetical protein